VADAQARITAAPLIVGDLVAGVAGADDGIRGFLAAYRPAVRACLLDLRRCGI
jgi:hypothetical protein